MMPRYIDADAALKRFEEIHGNESNLLNCYNADWIVSFIETQPTADVQEVKHGRWIEQVKIRKDGEVRLVHWQCSLCGCFLGTNIANYCPNCGARMFEEEKNNEQN